MPAALPRPSFGGIYYGMPRPERFTIGASIGGYEVLDFDGRPVIERPTERAASEAAGALNEAAWEGQGSFIAELSALSDDQGYVPLKS